MVSVSREATPKLFLLNVLHGAFLIFWPFDYRYQNGCLGVQTKLDYPMNMAGGISKCMDWVIKFSFKSSVILSVYYLAPNSDQLTEFASCQWWFSQKSCFFGYSLIGARTNGLLPRALEGEQVDTAY